MYLSSWIVTWNEKNGTTLLGRAHWHYIVPLFCRWVLFDTRQRVCQVPVFWLGKFLFAWEVYAGWPLLSATLWKVYAQGFWPFAECFWHLAYVSIPVVYVQNLGLDGTVSKDYPLTQRKRGRILLAYTSLKHQWWDHTSTTLLGWQ